MDVLFVRGHFTTHNAVLAGNSLAAFAIGLPVFALVKILTPGFFGRGDTMTPLKIGILAVALNLGMNLIFMHPLKAVGPALATSLSSACNALLLAWILRRRGHFTFDSLAKRRIPRLLLAHLQIPIDKAGRQLVRDGRDQDAIGVLIADGETAQALIRALLQLDLDLLAHVLKHLFPALRAT